MINVEERDPSAEFRILNHYDLADLIVAAEYKVLVKKKKKFLWSVEEKVVVDNYKIFLNSNTKLIASLNRRGFLIFNDLIAFLKNKEIVFENQLSESELQKFETRDEYAILLNFQNATKLLEKLNELEISDEDLKKNDIDNLHEFIDNLFDKQRAEIETLIEALKKVKPDMFLLIRIID